MTQGAPVTRRTALASLGAAALSACAAPERLAQLGGDGPPAPPPQDPGGAEPRGGIGGTGITVGVIGTLTGFGSLRVNGVTLLTDARQAPSPLGPLALAPGHVIEAGAARVNAGLELRGLRAVVAVAGPVTRALSSDGRLEVVGLAVQLEPGAPPPVGGAPAGRRLAVSGLWRGDVLVASRLDPVADAAPDVLSGVLGEVLRSRAGDAARLGPAVVQAPPGALRSGEFHVLTGRWPSAGSFVAEAAEVGRPLLDRRLDAFSAEGYLRGDAERGYALSGLGAALEPGPRIAQLASGRAVFIGAFDGRFRISHGIPLPEGATPRAFALDRVGDGFAPGAGAVDTR